MERENVQKALEHAMSLGVHPYEIENYYKKWLKQEMCKWLNVKHKPFWFLFNDGDSAPELDPAREVCGIWVSDYVVISPFGLMEEDSYDKAKEIASKQRAGKFMYDVAFFESLSLLFKKQSQLQEVFSRIGKNFSLEGRTLWSSNLCSFSNGSLTSMTTDDGYTVEYDDISQKKHSAAFTIDFSQFR